MEQSGSRESVIQKSIRHLISWCFPSDKTEKILLKDTDEFIQDDDFNPLLFYKQIQPTGNEPILDINPPLLNITLRKYQSRAVNWMLQRENEQNIIEIPNPMWRCIKCSATTFYYNPYSAELSKELPLIKYETRGGILADEMGLGKTIELLACILSNPNKNINQEKNQYLSDMKKLISEKMEIDNTQISNNVKCYCRPTDNITDFTEYIECEMCKTWQHFKCVGYSNDNLDDSNSIYLCPDCSFHSSNKIPSNTTLIICPSAILQQWRHEIVRRTSLTALKILIYEGITNPNRLNQLSGKSKKQNIKDFVTRKFLCCFVHYIFLIIT